MPLDITQRKLAELLRTFEAGKISAEKYRERKAKLVAKGPQWLARYKDISGKDVYEGAKSKTEAKHIEQERQSQIRGRTYTAPDLLRATVKKIVEIYLDEKLPAKAKSERTVCGHIVSKMGHVQLERLDRDPSIMVTHYRGLPEKWAIKYKYNYRLQLRAAIQYYMDSRRLKITLNPIDAVKIPKGTRRRTVYPTFAEVEIIIETARRNPAHLEIREGKPPVRRGYPVYFPALLAVRYDHGLRGMEVVPLRYEECHLEPPQSPIDPLPYFRMELLKQGEEEPEILEIPFKYRSWKEIMKLAGQKERGKVFPIKNWPTKQMRRLFTEAGFPHLVPHDMRRTWSKSHQDLDSRQRRMLRGHSEAMDDYYMIEEREDREKIYRSSWDRFFSGDQTGTKLEGIGENGIY